MTARYATGKHAKGQCQRCGFEFPYSRLVDDKYKPGLRVCEGCADAKHPAEKPLEGSDAIALRRPAPMLDTDGGPADDVPNLAEAMGWPHYHGGGT
jgi:hypothetical protein